MPAVVVLVGTSGSGKTTLRRRWLAEGLPADVVVSLDDLRREALDDDLVRGRRPRRLQDYSAAAVRRATARYDALAGFGAGYLADATHLRRRDRTPHVRAAGETGLRSVAVLLPLLHLDELLRRDAARPVGERVPAAVLARQRHRRSLLSAGMLADEGFDEVLEG
jgi:predicted kinase